MNSNVEKLQRTRSFPTIRTESSPGGEEHWLYMHSDIAAGVRPCCRTEMLEDMWSFMSSITLRDGQRQPGKLRSLVLASEASAFNLGGDLELFSQLIRDNNRERLLAYARRCIEGVHHLHTGFGGDIRTIALIQGDALGGGLEMALACHTIVAEEGVDMGLPEVLFGLFPGMGAYSFLCKRVTPQLAEKIILAMNAVRNIAQPVGYDELMGVTEVWVDTALALGEKSLRTMDRIVRAQMRRSNSEAA